MTPELGRRIAFTVGALLVYRLGSSIPLPGINLSAWAKIFSANTGGVLGFANMWSGGAVGRLAIFALGIMPYLTAAILLQLAMFVSSKLRALRNGGDRERSRIVRYTFILTAVIALWQSYGIAGGLEHVGGLVTEPGVLFQLSTTVTLTAGALFLVWLADQITLRGIGNGIALLLAVPIVMGLPDAVVSTYELGRRGALSSGQIVALVGVVVVVIGFIVFMELARRHLPLQFAARQTGTDDRRFRLSLKMNSAGIIPALVASWVMLVILATSMAMIPTTGWGEVIARQLSHGRPLFLAIYAVAILLSAFIYTAFVIDPSQAAKNLARYGGAIAGVAVGEATAEHIDQVLSRTTLIGALYLAAVCVIPEILISYAAVPFYFGGTALFVVVCTVLDIDAQARSEGARIVESGG